MMQESNRLMQNILDRIGQTFLILAAIIKYHWKEIALTMAAIVVIAGVVTYVAAWLLIKIGWMGL